MRITNRLMTNNSIRNMSETLDDLYTLQQKAATGKKYLRPSENPSVAADNLTLNSRLRSIDTYTKTINSTMEWMETTDFALQKFSTALADAQQIVLKGLNESNGPDERKVMGEEIDGLLNQMIELANYKDQDRYVFSGFKTDTKPFELIKSSDPSSPTVTVTALSTDGVTTLTRDYHVDTVVYNGDDNIIKRGIAEDEDMIVNINGGTAFTNSTKGGNVFDPDLADIFATMIRIRDYLVGEDYLKMHVSSNYIQPTPPATEGAVPADTSGIDPAAVTPAYTTNDVLNRTILEEAYANLQSTTEKITSHMTTNGARMKILETSLERTQAVSLEIKSLISSNEEVNMAELLSEISNQELVYQAAIQISGRTSATMSLFDRLG